MDNRMQSMLTNILQCIIYNLLTYPVIKYI
nr:MAG TPA: hypothetical protein [Caudoviricetes sp.]